MPPGAGQREDRIAANFSERRVCELLRITLPRTPVNRPHGTSCGPSVMVGYSSGQSPEYGLKIVNLERRRSRYLRIHCWTFPDPDQCFTFYIFCCYPLFTAVPGHNINLRIR